jgi:hypothetical protein
VGSGKPSDRGDSPVAAGLVEKAVAVGGWTGMPVWVGSKAMELAEVSVAASDVDGIATVGDGVLADAGRAIATGLAGFSRPATGVQELIKAIKVSEIASTRWHIDMDRFLNQSDQLQDQ